MLLLLWQDRNANSIGQSVPCLWIDEATVGVGVSIFERDVMETLSLKCILSPSLIFFKIVIVDPG